jgi:uncharacterized membrane protein (DUF373 family)
MAISRKVIIFDFKELTPMYIFATASVVLALGITYWLISKKEEKIIPESVDSDSSKNIN